MIVLPDDGIVDEVAVARACAGDTTVRLTVPERYEVARRMHASGRPPTHIADVLHLSNRTVYRLLACLTDERCRPLRLAGLCDRCAHQAGWQVTYPDGLVREFCLLHACGAIERMAVPA